MAPASTVLITAGGRVSLRRLEQVKRKGESLGDRWHRMLLSVMGPPQLGPYGDPIAAHPDDSLCTRCQQPRVDHEIVRSPGLTYSQCRPPREQL